MKLLLAEDTADLNNVVTSMLKMQGFDVDSAKDGEEAMELALSNGYDGIILDIMMPKINGLDVLKELRARNITTPVLMLTAKAEVDDRVEGLDAGADDYLTKPFAMKELLARVKAMTRRGSKYSTDELSYGDVTLRSQSLELSAFNTVRLSLKECELMETLLLNLDHPLEVQYLMELLWKDDPEVTEDTVWLYVNFLQGKLGYIDSKVIIDGEKEGPFRLLTVES